MTKHRENPQPKLNITEKQNFNEYWRNLYDDTDKIGQNRRVESEPPAKQNIKYIIDHLPMKKAPGPDKMTAELLKYGGK